MEGCFNARLFRVLRRFDVVVGVIQNVSARVTAQARVANTRTGRIIRLMEIPEALMAMASLSEESRLKPVRIPMSTAIGKVTVRTAGR